MTNLFTQRSVWNITLVIRKAEKVEEAEKAEEQME